jgi:hypothetical protein
LVANGNLWNPNGAKQVRPPQSARLLKGAFNVGTEDAVGRVLADQLALAAQPLPFRDEGDAVALLMHRQVAAVAKHNCIRVLAISIVADGAFRVLLLARAAQDLAIDRRRRARSWSLGLGRF